VQDVPATLHTSVNAGVLAHLQGKSAHGDIADALLASVAPLGDVQAFSPDAASYRYVLVSTKGVVFGLAVAHRRPDDDWPAVDLTFWARKVYVHARALTASVSCMASMVSRCRSVLRRNIAIVSSLSLTSLAGGVLVIVMAAGLVACGGNDTGGGGPRAQALSIPRHRANSGWKRLPRLATSASPRNLTIEALKGAFGETAAYRLDGGDSPSQARVFVKTEETLYLSKDPAVLSAGPARQPGTPAAHESVVEELKTLLETRSDLRDMNSR
jgi:hypothetical protein